MSYQAGKRKILLIEDNKVLNKLMTQQLEAMSYEPKGVVSWEEAKSFLEYEEPDLVIMDVRLPDADGLELLKHFYEFCPVIIMTAYGSIESAVEAIKQGASEYIVKPLNIDELELVIKKVFNHSDLRKDFKFVSSQELTRNKSLVFGVSNPMKQLGDMINAISDKNTNILINGENGVGKELVAREIHKKSYRKDRNFVTIDCCSTDDEQFEEMLFGKEKEEGSSYSEQNKGLIENAKDGTLFLDCINEVSFAMQGKLLKVIESGKYRRVGGVKELNAFARFIASSSADLIEDVKKGRFRDDLYYQLQSFIINVPSLKDRKEDIPYLVEYYISNHDFSRKIDKNFSDEALKSMQNYHWPGNIRELRNIIERAIIMSGENNLITNEHLGLPEKVKTHTHQVNFSFDHEPTLEEIKSGYFISLFKKYNGHRHTIAKHLGISERNVYRMIKKYLSN